MMTRNKSFFEVLLIACFVGGLLAGGLIVALYFREVSPPSSPAQKIEKQKEITQKKEVISKDGTRTIFTTVEKTVDKVVLKPELKNYHLGVGVGDNVIRPVYSLQAEKRIFGPVFLGARIGTDASWALLLSMEF